MKIKGISILSFASLLVIIMVNFLPVGCAKPSKTTNVAPKPTTPKEIVTINYKPDWLLIGGVGIGKDLTSDKSTPPPGSGGGAYMKVGDRITTDFLTGIGGFEIKGSPDITFSFYYGGRIIYWKGKGEITNLRTGERVFVPIREK